MVVLKDIIYNNVLYFVTTGRIFAMNVEMKMTRNYSKRDGESAVKISVITIYVHSV